MKRNFISFLLVLLVACFSVTVAGNGNNPKPRPFKGSMSGEATFDFISGACLDVTGAPWQTLGYMIGDLSHLGESEWFVSHCSTPDGLQLVNGQGTFVAANGDELWMTYTAELISPFTVPGVMLYAQDNVVTGGTGRFEGAAGEFQTLLAVTLEDLTVPTTPVSAEFAGKIIY
jgi:hypothetical protein